MRIGVELDHDTALAVYTAAGHDYPTIPPGKNTVWHHFTTVDGLPAVIVNQGGFTPGEADDEEQVNGCALVVALDAPDVAKARAALDQWLHQNLPVQ